MADTASPPAPAPGPAPAPIPGWAQDMRDLFRSGSVAQFILYGNVFDWVPARQPGGGQKLLPLKNFLEEVMFAQYDVVLH